jgi:hypothetical protein
MILMTCKVAGLDQIPYVVLTSKVWLIVDLYKNTLLIREGFLC